MDSKLVLNPLSANPTKWSNPTNCLSVFDHFVGLAFKGLNRERENAYVNILEKLRVNTNTFDVSEFMKF